MSTSYFYHFSWQIFLHNENPLSYSSSVLVVLVISKTFYEYFLLLKKAVLWLSLTCFVFNSHRLLCTTLLSGDISGRVRSTWPWEQSSRPQRHGGLSARYTCLCRSSRCCRRSHRHWTLNSRHSSWSAGNFWWLSSRLQNVLILLQFSPSLYRK